MRRLAQALDTGAASLYVYVANRNELWELALRRRVGTVQTEPTDPARWREQLHGARRPDGRDDGRAASRAWRASRWPTSPPATTPCASPSRCSSLLKAGGAGDQAAAYALDLVSSYATTIAYEQSLYAQLYEDPEHAEREIAKIAARFASVAPERYPTIAALGKELTSGDGDERFALGLDVIINGLLSTPIEGRFTHWPGGRRP